MQVSIRVGLRTGMELSAKIFRTQNFRVVKGEILKGRGYIKLKATVTQRYIKSHLRELLLTSLSSSDSVGKSIWIWEQCSVKSDPAKVAVFLIIQTTSSPLTSETYTGRKGNCYLKTQRITGRHTEHTNV